MFKDFRKTHNLTKKEVRANIEFFERMSGITLLEGMTITYDDSIMLTDKALKAILSLLGWNIQSLEVKKGDKVKYNGQWEVDINLSNVENEMIGVFTRLDHPDLSSIQNFTTRQYIQEISDIGGPNWEKWFEESAVMASLKQTIRRSKLSFLAKPIIMIRPEDEEPKEVEQSLIQEIVNQATKEMVETGEEAKPEVKEPEPEVKEPEPEVKEAKPEVKEPEPEDTQSRDRDELVKEIARAWPGWKRIKVGKNLSRRNWRINRDILEKFAEYRNDEEQQMMVDLLNSVKPYGIKDEVINFNRDADGSFNPDSEDTRTPFDMEEPKCADGDIEAWKEAKRSIESQWANGTGDEAVLLAAKDSLLDSIPEGLATGPIKVGNSWDRRILADEEPEHTPGKDDRLREIADWKAKKTSLEKRWAAGEGDPNKLIQEKDALLDCMPEGLGIGAIKVGNTWQRIHPTANKPMTAREWMGAFGELELRWEKGEYGVEMQKEAATLQKNAPTYINISMIRPDKYLKASKNGR